MPFTPQEKREYYENNPEALERHRQQTRDNLMARYHNDVEFRTLKRERALRYYYMKKRATAATTLEATGMVKAN